MTIVDACIKGVGGFRDSNTTHINNLTIKEDHPYFSIVLHYEQGEISICRDLSKLKVLSVDYIIYCFAFFLLIICNF